MATQTYELPEGSQLGSSEIWSETSPKDRKEYFEYIRSLFPVEKSGTGQVWAFELHQKHQTYSDYERDEGHILAQMPSAGQEW